MQDQYQRRTKKAWHVLYTSGNYNVLVVYLFIEKLFPVYHVCCKKIWLYFLEYGNAHCTENGEHDDDAHRCNNGSDGIFGKYGKEKADRRNG